MDDGLTEKQMYQEEPRQKNSQSFHESHGTYGSPKVHSGLMDQGFIASQKTVARMMRQMELKETPDKGGVVTTNSKHDLPVYPNLVNRNFHVVHPNDVWVSDLTYVRTFEEWLYAASIMDLFFRKIIGYSLEADMRMEQTIKALSMDLTTRQPSEGLIHHSDRGAQYCLTATRVN